MIYSRLRLDRFVCFNRYRQITSLKLKNENLKVLLSVTDNSNGADFSRMTSSKQGRQRFVESALDILEMYDFDGIDIDWEFPAWRGLPSYDKPNFVYLIKALRKYARKRKMNDLIVSAAVAAPLKIVSKSYDIPELSKYDIPSCLKYDILILLICLLGY